MTPRLINFLFHVFRFLHRDRKKKEKKKKKKKKKRRLASSDSH